jgi:hypothetical protein
MQPSGSRFTHHVSRPQARNHLRSKPLPCREIGLWPDHVSRPQTRHHPRSNPFPRCRDLPTGPGCDIVWVSSSSPWPFYAQREKSSIARTAPTPPDARKMGLFLAPRGAEEAIGDGVEALGRLKRRLQGPLRGGFRVLAGPRAPGEGEKGGWMGLWEAKMGQKSSIPLVLGVGEMLEFCPRARKGATMGQKGGENGKNGPVTVVLGRFCHQGAQ